jgi:hypothetical protein
MGLKNLYLREALLVLADLRTPIFLGSLTRKTGAARLPHLLSAPLLRNSAKRSSLENKICKTAISLIPTMKLQLVVS